MIKKSIIGALLILAMLNIYAGNSIFSYDGFPLRYYGKDVYSMGMGDAGASDVFRYNTGFANPALHNRSNRTLFATGLQFGYTQYGSQAADGKEYSFRDDSLDLPYFSLSVPLSKHRFGFQFSSLSSGVVENQTTFTTANGVTITEKQKMDRYLYRGDIVYSYLLGNSSLGVSGNYYFGHDTRTFIQDGGFEVFNTIEELSRTFKNPTFTVGALTKHDKFAFGAHFTYGTTLKGGEIRTSLHSTEPEVEYELKLPNEFGASITVLPFAEHKVAADLQYEMWSSVDGAKYDDSWKLGVGWSYEPRPEFHTGYINQLPLRAGLSYRRLAFTANDAAIDEMGISAGITFPLKREVNRVDVGFQLTRRGSMETNKLTDTSFMLMLGFTGFDLIGKATNRTAPRDIPEREVMEAW